MSLGWMEPTHCFSERPYSCDTLIDGGFSFLRALLGSIAWQKTLRKLPHGPFASSYCILYFSSKRPVHEAGIENLPWAGTVLSDVCVSQQRDIRGRAGNPSSSRSPNPAELPPLRVCRQGCGFPRDTLFYQCSHGWARSALGSPALHFCI